MNARIEKRIDEAIAIGEANKRIIGLAQNWCAHLRVEHRGGVGMVEASTGLPIGMRALTCPYARGPGFAGMDLEFVALDFYDRNCATCSERKPVGLPNLTELVGRRDRDRARREAEEARWRSAEAANLAARRAKREARKEAATEARADSTIASSASTRANVPEMATS